MLSSSTLNVQQLGQKMDLGWEGIDCSRRSRTSEIHAAVDVKSRPFRLKISGGQLHGHQMRDAFLE